MSGEITRSGLGDLLKTLMDERRSTTVYVATDDNHLIAVGLERGELVYLICGPRQGERALPMIERMRSGTYRLDDSASVHRRADVRLPTREALLSLLATGSNAPTGDGDRMEERLCKLLTRYMGPIAPLVCRQTIEAAGGLGSTDKLRDVVEALAGEIDHPEEAERFRKAARLELALQNG
jgi:hypothetical protein